MLVADVANASGSGVTSFEHDLYRVEVTSAGEPLKVTLVWTDPPGSIVSGKRLRNDIDLIVTGPDGTVYKGNQWTPDDVNVPGDKQSAPNPSGRDDVNNVEGVLILAATNAPTTIMTTSANCHSRIGFGASAVPTCFEKYAFS